MSERSLSVNPVIEPCAGGVIGLGIGYSLAPRKYSLQHLLMLKEDTFQKIYSKELEENLSPNEQKALFTLKNARKDYRASKIGFASEVNKTAKEWTGLFKQVDVPQRLTEAYETSRNNLRQAIKETDYVRLNQEYRKAKAALKQSPDDPALKAALTEANTALSKAKAIIGSKIDLYKDSAANIANERLRKVKSEPIKYANVREAYHNFLKALAKRRTLASNKLFNLANNKNIIKSYETLSSYLPKARTKSAIGGAAIVGTLTSLIVANMAKSSKRRIA